jgi:HTH-type transcriptional repressor of NAD biosynthesis genes
VSTKRGLTLGKYAPLHKGHQLVIDTAVAEMDEVIVIIYDSPDTTKVPLNIRAGWLRSLYPGVKIIEAWDGPTIVGYTPEIMRMHETYVINTLKIQGISHFYSSEPYGEHMSEALGAVNRTVDLQRKTVPVSASAISEDPFRYRNFIHPLVYRDLIINIVFLGAPCTGKTTIAERLAREYSTQWMPEYGREYWEKHQANRRLSLEQLVEIAEGHIRREEKLLLESNRFLFTDTNPITTLTFSRYYHGTALPRLIELADKSASRYDLVFVCDVDIPYEDTWDRSGEVKRKTFQQQVLADLLERKIPFITLRGDIKQRIDRVKQIVDGFDKYTNIMDL